MLPQKEGHMKIRCSRCGKRFDADVYSGLCPKCGAYNGKHMADYEEAAAEWEKPETKAIKDITPAKETKAKETKAKKELKLKPQKRGGGPAAGKMIAAAIMIPIAAAVVFQIWKNIYFQERISAAEEIVRESGNSQINLIEGMGLEYPVYTAVLGIGQLPSDEVPEGWHLEGIYVSSSCDGYNSEAEIRNIQLGYTVGDEAFFQKTVSLYELEYLTEEWGIDWNELLTEYDFGYGEASGYLVFMVRDGAENRELIFEVENRDSGKVTRQVSVTLDHVQWFVPESGVEE